MFKHKLALIATAVAAATGSFSVSADDSVDIGLLKNGYSVMVWQDFSARSGSGNGTIAAGNNILIDYDTASFNGKYGSSQSNGGYSLSAGQSTSSIALVAGNNVAFGEGALFGNIYAGKTVDLAKNYVLDGGKQKFENVEQDDLPFDFDDAKEDAKELSLALDNKQNTGSVILRSSAELVLKASDSDDKIQVFTINGEDVSGKNFDLANIRSIYLEGVDADTTVVVNFKGEHPQLSGGLHGFTAEKTVFNFPQANTLNITSFIDILAVVLAPDADIESASGNAYMAIIAKSLVAQGGSGAQLTLSGGVFSGDLSLDDDDTDDGDTGGGDTGGGDTGGGDTGGGDTGGGDTGGGDTGGGDTGGGDTGGGDTGGGDTGGGDTGGGDTGGGDTGGGDTGGGDTGGGDTDKPLACNGLYGVSGLDNKPMVYIDLEKGLVQQPFEFDQPNHKSDAVAYDKINDRLYYITKVNGALKPKVAYVNMQTGEDVKLAEIDGGYRLVFSPDSTQLFASSGRDIVEINPTTGAVISKISLKSNDESITFGMGDLVFIQDELYIVSQLHLIKVDLVNKQATVLGKHGVNGATGAEVDSEGNLLISKINNATAQTTIYSINVTELKATAVATVDYAINDLALRDFDGKTCNTDPVDPVEPIKSSLVAIELISDRQVEGDDLVAKVMFSGGEEAQLNINLSSNTADIDADFTSKVSVSFDDGQTWLTDIVAKNGSVTVPENAKSALIKIHTLTDTEVENDESLRLEVSFAHDPSVVKSELLTIVDKPTGGDTGGGDACEMPKVSFITALSIFNGEYTQDSKAFTYEGGEMQFEVGFDGPAKCNGNFQFKLNDIETTQRLDYSALVSVSSLTNENWLNNVNVALGSATYAVQEGDEGFIVRVKTLADTTKEKNEVFTLSVWNKSDQSDVKYKDHSIENNAATDVDDGTPGSGGGTPGTGTPGNGNTDPDSCSSEDEIPAMKFITALSVDEGRSFTKEGGKMEYYAGFAKEASCSGTFYFSFADDHTIKGVDYSTNVDIQTWDKQPAQYNVDAANGAAVNVVKGTAGFTITLTTLADDEAEEREEYFLHTWRKADKSDLKIKDHTIIDNK
ncbi:choice-of-anchor A family protein [Pseudoalteromonas tunicata]|uniref:choice-of-anchor A family protein n=2 Tax=Pseudoalteromonas tunicata TaxID=314281 RepID=UPI00273D9CC9|nr:choice-of-anchor A family protein [Pseudoalteromonas tunicata]MDP5212807.1 choice-of-anchor A family protein [Pseudoalteromonas tunicata]